MKQFETYLKRENLPDNATHLRVSVYYNRGGMSNLTYKRCERGYYIGVQPVNRDPETCSASFTMFTGSAALLRPTDSYSASEYAVIVRFVKDHLNEIIDDIFS